VAAVASEGAQLFAVGVEGPARVSSAMGRISDVLIEPLGQLALASVVQADGAVKLQWLRADGREGDIASEMLFPASAHTNTCGIEVQP
jgi:hypothetical protein